MTSRQQQPPCHLLACLPNLGCLQKDAATAGTRTSQSAAHSPQLVRSPPVLHHQQPAAAVVPTVASMQPGRQRPADSASSSSMSSYACKLHQTMQWLLDVSTVDRFDVDSPAAEFDGQDVDVTSTARGHRHSWQTASPNTNDASAFHSASFRDSDSSCSTSTMTSDSTYRGGVDFRRQDSLSRSRSYYDRRHHPHQQQNQLAAPGGASFDDSYQSTSSYTGSAVSNAVTTERVVLDLEEGAGSSGSGSGSTGNAAGGGLGITILGRRSEAGGGIFVGAVKPKGAARRSGKIRPGDMLVEVNGVSLNALTNEQALAALRDQVKRGGKLCLVVGRCRWDFEGPRTSNDDDELYYCNSQSTTSASDISSSTRHGSISGDYRRDRPTFRRFPAPPATPCTTTTASSSNKSPPEVHRRNAPRLPHSFSSFQALQASPAGPIQGDSGYVPAAGGSHPFVGNELVDWIVGRLRAGKCGEAAGHLDEREAAGRYAASLLEYGYIVAVAPPGECDRSSTEVTKFCEKSVYEFTQLQFADASMMMMNGSSGGVANRRRREI